MDVLLESGLEPQLAIPVIFVVVGAIIVYVFGFQKTEEPSYAHLAVLQSSSSYKNRSVTTTSSKAKSSVSTSTGSKPKANGHVVADKEKNGVIKRATPKAEVNKENKPPQVKVQAKKDKVKVQSAKPEDFESGEWIQATSRKDKKKKTPGQNQPEPTTPKREREAVSVAKPVVVEEIVKEEPVVLKEVEPAQQNQTPTVQAVPEKKDKKSGKAGKDSSAESSPKKQAKAQEAKPAVVAVEEKKAAKENVTPVEVAKKTPEVKVVEEPVAAAPGKPKGNIAFDEMGDQWEEAKSRGAKKRTRARKD